MAMPDKRTEIARLRSAAGPGETVRPETVRAARAALLDAAAGERVDKPMHNRRRPWRGRTGVALAATTFVVVAGAAAYVDSVPSDPAAGLVCAENVSTEPSGSVIRDDGRTFAAQCAEVWQSQGKLSAGAAAGSITACDSGHGAVYVYQSDRGVCDRLGLPAASRS
jgi:hypothetical protein